MTLTDNQRRRDALEKEVAALKEEGLLILGQVKALTQQLQRDTEAAGRLAEEEQALTKAWQETCASLHITRDIAQEINDWMQEQERYEQQLYQLSQRLMLQSQLNDQQALERRAEQQLAATRRGLESALQALALSLPAEGTKPHGCTLAKANLPSGRRNRPNMMPFSSKSLLCGHCWRRCRPATRQRLKLSRPSRTTGAKSTRNACRCTASLSPSSSRKPVKRRVWTSRRRNSPPPRRQPL